MTERPAYAHSAGDQGHAEKPPDGLGKFPSGATDIPPPSQTDPWRARPDICNTFASKQCVGSRGCLWSETLAGPCGDSLAAEG